MLFFALNIFAQDDFYRSTSNQFYWKNRIPNAAYWQQDVHYKMKAVLDDKTDIIDGVEELTYYNNSPDTLSFVYFHLYQNAFVKGSYLEKLNIVNGYKQKFGKYELDGKGTEIEKLIITNCNDKKLSYEVHQSSNINHTGVYDDFINTYEGVEGKIEFIDNTIIKVALPCNLNPNSSVTFKIKFKTYFDGGGDQRRRMQVLKDNWGNKQFKVVHWYPRICVYDRKFGWETDQHLGKEFYGDFGWYDAELTLPNNYVMDGTGVLQNRSEVLPDDLRAKLDIKNFKDKPLDSAPDSTIIPKNGTTKTWKFHADNVHDFAWVADPTFRIGETKITLPNGHEVSCIALAKEPHASRWQDASLFNSKIIETYSRDIGAYVYPKMIVADASDGMEYPMLTLDGGLSPGYYGLFAHEVGHNWFFGMVGNNETYRAALDEGFTQFLTNWSMTSLFGEIKPSKKNPHPISRMDQTVYFGYVRDAINHDDPQLNTHSDDFNSALNHGGGYGHVYYKTATMLYNLQYVLGDELFLKAMQHYFDQWKICHPYFEDFRSSIINYTHVDLNWFFDQWLETTKSTDYAIQSLERMGKIQPSSKIDTSSIKLSPYILNSSVNQYLYKITFSRKGEMQMPIDFTVFTKDSSYKFYIPNTYFIKKTDATILPMWKGWGLLNKTHEAVIVVPGKIENIQIDPTYRLADINQLDNSTKYPSYFAFDNGIRKPVNRKYEIYTWRPDVWYNSVDGLKAGLNFNSNYMNHEVFNATVWYNTTLVNNYSGSANNIINLNLNWRTAIGKDYFMNENFRFIDGLFLFKYGVEKTYGKRKVEIYWKAFKRFNNSDIDYVLYPTQWGNQGTNGSLNIDITHNYSYMHGYGELKAQIRGSLLSNYDYSRLTETWINHHNFGKLELHTRVFVQAMMGNNIAPESMLNLAGGNSEEMMENKFVRSRGFVPNQWLGYGDNYNHFQFAGGMNIRGYAGYLVPVNFNNFQYYLNSGTAGASVNAELDFDKLIPLTPKRLSPYFHFDLYFFGDAGYLENQFVPSLSNNINEKTLLNTGLIASAGNGIIFTIKKWGKFDEAKPLTIRFDMPWYLSNAPYVDGQNFRFRWIVGLNRAF